MTSATKLRVLTTPGADLEDISTKTGSFKKFGVFVRMLMGALRRASDSVSLDVLTYADLEQLKARRGAGSPAYASTLAPNNKRYLILTYAAEFDRVHYPLPLQFEEHPDPAHLKVSLEYPVLLLIDSGMSYTCGLTQGFGLKPYP